MSESISCFMANLAFLKLINSCMIASSHSGSIWATPCMRIYVYTQKTSNGRRGHDFGGVHHEPHLPTNLYHGGYVVLAVAPELVGPAMK